MPELFAELFCIDVAFDFHILWQQGAEQDGHHKYHCYTVCRKDILDDLREDSPDVHFTCGGKADSYRQRQRHDGDVSLGEACFGNHLDSADHDGSKHHQSTSAQHRLRQAGKEVAHRWQQTCQHHADGAGHQGKAVDHAGHVD